MSECNWTFSSNGIGTLGIEFVHKNTNRRSFFLSDPVRPVGGVEDADGVDDARPSVLYAPTGP